MRGEVVMAGTVAILIGYLLGSLLPAYFLGRAEGVDLRRVGTGNPGATNAWHVLGPAAGVVTLLFDMSKGLVAMAVATSLGAAPIFVYGAGIAAVVGHRFPFYLRFDGGEGVGTSVGLLLFALAVALSHAWLPIGALATLALAVAIIFGFFRRGPVVAVFVLPVLAVLLLPQGDVLYRVFLALVLANIWSVNVGIVRDEHLVATGPGWQAVRHALTGRADRR
jgi:glycerol-3-phosphate acyltransferase PlsY